MSSNLIGKTAIIRGNDFVERDLSAFIVMVDVDNKSILLELDAPLKSASTTYRHVVASPRSSKDGLDSIGTTDTLGCSVTWVPDDKYDPNKPVDLSWWRGGAAAITDLCIN